MWQLRQHKFFKSAKRNAIRVEDDFGSDEESYSNDTDSDDGYEDEESGRGSFITLDGDGDEEEEYSHDSEDEHRDHQFINSRFRGYSRNRNLSRKNKLSRRGNSVDQTHRLKKQKHEKLECTLVIGVVVFGLALLLILGFITIYSKSNNNHILQKDNEKGFIVHNSNEDETKIDNDGDGHHSHSHILRGDAKHGKRKARTKIPKIRSRLHHHAASNASSYFESILPVLPFDEFIFENNPISKYRFYTKHKMSIQRFDNVHLGKHTPLVSVITTCRNLVDAFKHTRDSIIHQTLKYFEWVVISDTNDAKGKPKDFLLKALRLSPMSNLISQTDAESVFKSDKITLVQMAKELSTGALRNIATKHISPYSRYLMFLDSGDMLEPSALEKMFLFIEIQKESRKNQKKALKTISLINSNSVQFSKIYFFNFEKFQEMTHRIPFEPTPFSSFMIEKEVFDSVDGFNTQFDNGLELWDFWMKFINAGHRGWTMSETLIWNRIDESRKIGTRVEHEPNSQEHEFIETHLKKLYPSLYKKKALESLKKHGYLKKINPEVQISKPIIRRLSHQHHKVHKGNHKSILIITENLNHDLHKLEIVQQLLTAFSLEYNWHVTIITTDGSGFNHRYKSEFERFTNDVFHVRNIVDSKELVNEKHVSLLAMYLMSSRHIHNVFIFESQLAYKILHMIPQAIADYTHVIDYMYSTHTTEYIKESVKNDALLHKTFLSSNDLSSNFGQFIEIKSDKKALLFPSAVNNHAWSPLNSVTEFSQYRYQEEKAQRFSMLGDKQVLEFDNNDHLVLSYIISGEENSRCDSMILKILSKILQNTQENLKSIKIMLLTDIRSSYLLDQHPDPQKRSVEYLSEQAKISSQTLAPFEELAKNHPSRVLFVKPTTQSTTRSLRNVLKRFSPLAHITLMTETCPNVAKDSPSVTLAPTIFQAMAIKNAVIALHNNNPSVESFFKSLTLEVLFPLI
ncbi:hypothetical protein C9374_004631 [Naegleria lovaniensis]|uniref:Glycosyltransferase n=1 Tax=Naegleria lovaniensis TaxID=51637 RepID=A0AA88GLS2_NAELO|nr:uncharacterized protein C9374_004631 [Naegleria lovaniensis]KAG2383294.1 hypothetical protein C9374_004631 [Naegleria lovaniensis]